MKKVILGAAALMLGAVSYGQISGGTISDQLTVNEAASLSTDPDANDVEIDQGGLDNYVLTRQEGKSNSVLIDQVSFPNDNNTIYVRQSGDVNGNEPNSGYDNHADVQQGGQYNEAWIRQEGDENRAGMVQTAASDNSIGYIRQGTGQNAQNNEAGVYQDGDDLSSWIQQTFDNSQALSKQTGDDHASVINQDAGPNQTDGHVARVIQDGDNQKSNIEQDGNNSEANVEQEGDSNYSKVTQSGLGTNSADVFQSGADNKSNVTSAGKDQVAEVDQIGDDNKADIDQTGAFGNDAKVYQQGENNYAKQEQTNGAGAGTNYALVNQGNLGDAMTMSELDGLYDATNDILETEFIAGNPDSVNGIAFQTQDGEGNRAESHQFGEDSWGFGFGVAPNYSKQVQSGSGNEGLVVQNAFSSDLGPFNVAPDGANFAQQEQTGSGNSASLIQRDAGNDSYQVQTGDNNSAMAVQRGLNHTLVSKQEGNDNFIETGQQGLGNTIHALQKGGHSTIVDQAGTGNQVDVFQTGANGNLLDTMDCTIPDPMTPGPLDCDMPELPNLNLDPLCQGPGC